MAALGLTDCQSTYHSNTAPVMDDTRDNRNASKVSPDFDFGAICGRPSLWLAPMVGQSEPAFRMLCRKYGATLCTTPMIDPAGYVRSEKYREEFPFFPEDRPLVVQFGGSDPAMLLAAAQLVATHCDAVELNCGCPQRCAKQGGYGAFLMEQPELLESLVRALAQDDSSSTCTDSSSSNSHSNSTSSNSSNNSSSSGGGGIRRPDGTRLPVFVKVRVFDDVAATIALCLRVEAAGADALTVHGRTRHQGGGRHQGRDGANWATIAAVKRALKIPVVSNGNVRCFGDVSRCLAVTGCDGVMSGCGLLADPTLFAGSCRGNGGGDSSVGNGRASASEKLQYCKPGREGNDLSEQLQQQCCSSAPPPSAAVALEYVRLADIYGATHQQVTKHLSAYLGPILKTRPLMRAKILAFRGGEAAPGTNRQGPKGHVVDDITMAEARTNAPALARGAAFDELRALLEELEHDLASPREVPMSVCRP